MITYWISFLVSLVAITSCGTNSTSELNRKINLALRTHNSVDEQEWNLISTYIIENKKSFPDLIGEDQTVDQNALNNYILEYSRTYRRGQNDPEILRPATMNQNQVKPTVKVFIENSGSMDGYVKGTTEFEASLSDLLVQIQYHYDKENLKVNFVNTKVYPSTVSEVKDFVEALEPDKAPYKVGDRSVSKLNEILKMILDSTDQETVSILVSDCIYSLEPDKDTEGALEFQKSLTKGAFLEKSKDFDFSTVVVKMSSKFNGKYWKKDNSSEQLSNVERPFYIWIMGANAYVNRFYELIKTNELKGYQHSYYLSTNGKAKLPYYTVLSETNRQGNFKNADRGQKNITSIMELKYDNGKIQLAIAIDLSGIPVESSYLMNPNNYNVPEGYEIVSVEGVNRNKITQRDFITIEKSTASHIITVSHSNKYTVQDLSISLSNQIPQWVEETSSMDDRTILDQLDKTFGLEYLVKGVTEAYITQRPERNSYLTIIIDIKN